MTTDARMTSSLVAVAGSLLIYVDIFVSKVAWHGPVNAVEFTEALFPMVADIVQNGWYYPPQRPDFR